MRLLDRLVALQFLKLFMVSVLATPPLFMLGEFTENVDRYAQLGLTGTEILTGYLFRVPEYLMWAAPIAGLIAAVFTVHSMTAHREIVGAKSGGISFHRFVAPMLVVGALLTGLALGLTELVPRANERAYEILRAVEIRTWGRTDFVYDTEDGYTLMARRLTMIDETLTGVSLIKPGSGDQPEVQVIANDARYDEKLGWTLHNGHMRLLDGDGAELAAHAFERMRVPSLEERPEELLAEPPEADEMTYAELSRRADIVERSGGEPHELLVRREQRLAIPAATLVIILFGVPLATSSKRGGAAFGLGAALGTTILYILMLRVAGAFGESGSLDPYLAAWLPNAVFLAAGVGLMVKVRT